MIRRMIKSRLDTHFRSIESEPRQAKQKKREEDALIAQMEALVDELKYDQAGLTAVSSARESASSAN